MCPEKMRVFLGRDDAKFSARHNIFCFVRTGCMLKSDKISGTVPGQLIFVGPQCGT